MNEQYESHVRMARIYMQEAKQRRSNAVQYDFCMWLRNAAGNARKRAIASLKKSEEQLSLF